MEKENNSQDGDNQVTKSIKRALAITVESGGDVHKTLYEITRDIVSRLLEKNEGTNSQIENTARRVIKGVLYAVKGTNIPVSDAMGPSLEGIAEGARAGGKKAKFIAKRAVSEYLRNNKK